MSKKFKSKCCNYEYLVFEYLDGSSNKRWISRQNYVCENCYKDCELTEAKDDKKENHYHIEFCYGD